jgi:hypothetical protein
MTNSPISSKGSKQKALGIFIKTSGDLIQKWYLEHQEIVIVILIFIITLILVSPTLMPGLAENILDDEAKYVESGWRLLHANIRDLGWGPLVAFVYAPSHLIVGNSPDWFLLEDWIGRYILFSSLWWSMYYVSRQFKKFLNPLLLPGLLLISPAFFPTLENPSDAVFLTLSMFALGNLISFYSSHEIKHIWFASIFLGLGFLARVESLLLILIFIVLVIIISRHIMNYWKLTLAMIIPILAIFLLYTLALYVTTGKVYYGFTDRLYGQFTATPDVNGNRAFIDFLKNPKAQLIQIWSTIKLIPDLYLAFFGKQFGPVILLFSFWGIYSLIKRKALQLLFLPIIWALPASIFLVLYYHHIVPQTIFLSILFGAIGIQFAVEPGHTKWERRAVLLSFLLLTVISFIGRKPAFFVSGTLVTVALGLIGLVRLSNKSSDENKVVYISLSLMLFVGLMLHGNFPFPSYPQLGISPAEQAVHFLQNELTPGSFVLVPYALPAVASKMNGMYTPYTPIQFSTSEQLWKFVTDRGIKAVYTDIYYSDMVSLLNSGIGSYFSLGFTSSDGRIYIFNVIR